MIFDPWNQAKIQAGMSKLKNAPVLPEKDMSLDDLKKLSGVNDPRTSGESPVTVGFNKRAYEREHNIKPGTPEWFKLHFAKTSITGESPFSDK